MEAALQPTPVHDGVDPITGLATRWLFCKRAEEQWQRARDHGQTLSLILVSIDHFNECASAARELCLSAIGEIISSYSARGSADIAGRIRDHNFALMLPGVEARAAVEIAQQMCAETANLDLRPMPSGKPVTLSAGVASLVPQPSRLMMSLLVSADHGLKRAERLGGNQALLAA
jgi:diguanylate cyclase (GGDEF)-like protein